MVQESETKELIIQLYEDLKANGLCVNKYQFSHYWLNRSYRYLSALQSGNTTSSIEPLQNASVRIQLVCDAIALSDNERLVSRICILEHLREKLDREIYLHTAKQMQADRSNFHALANTEDKPTILLELE